MQVIGEKIRPGDTDNHGDLYTYDHGSIILEYGDYYSDFLFCTSAIGRSDQGQ